MFVKSKEVILLIYALGLYITILQWSYLQEKLVTVEYPRDDGGMSERWRYPASLNFILSLFSAVAAFLTEAAICKSIPKTHSSFLICWQTALSCALASPIGYKSLQFISYPFMTLLKSSKPVPVMIVGVLWFGKVYPWHKYLTVGLICLGIILFSSSLSSSASSTNCMDCYVNIGIGIVLIAIHLLMDAFTYNTEDKIFSQHHISANSFLVNNNLWQAIYLGCYLILTVLRSGHFGEGYRSFDLFWHSSTVRFDLLLFCLSGSLGHILIFRVIKEFGSLTWTTICVTRKLFTILLSIFMFGHVMSSNQWAGLIFAFLGMVLESVFSRRYAERETDKSKES